MSIALEAEGYRITTYTDGVSALDGFKTTVPDLVILDIKMPRMDGMETLRRLRQKSDLPVIFLTSKDEQIDELFGLKMGADDSSVSRFRSDSWSSGSRPFCVALHPGTAPQRRSTQRGLGTWTAAHGPGAPHLHVEKRAGRPHSHRISHPAGAS